MSARVRWGILSTGRIAHTFATALRHAGHAELIAVGSRNPATAEAFAGEFDVSRWHGSYEELANDPEVDAIYVATPHPLHHPNTILCLNAGKHVLCEKPFAVNARQAAEMVQRAREKSVFLMEAMWTRFLPAVRTARTWLDEGLIGDLRMVQASFGFRAEMDEASRLLAPELAGGGLLDVGVYALSLASFAMQQAPAQILSLADLGPTGVDEQAAFLLGYPGGAIAKLSCAVRTATVHDAYFYGTKGYIHLTAPFWCTTRAMRYEGEQFVEAFDQPHRCNGFEFQIDEVCRCIQQGVNESPGMPLDESVQIMETMDQIRGQWGLRYPGE